jgi:uncharacterized protein
MDFGQLAAIGASNIVFIVLAFIVGGVVKGTLGVGLPMFVIPILAHRMPAIQAIAVLIMPVLVSNLWQALQSGFSKEGLKRFLPLLATFVATTLITIQITLSLSDKTMRSVVAGVVLLAVIALSLPLKTAIKPKHETTWSAIVGFLSGLMGGVSTLSGPLIISYLMALRLPREVFVGTVSVIYLAGAISIYGSMTLMGAIPLNDFWVSCWTLIPMSIGLVIGQRIRGKLSESVFKKVMLGFLSVVAISLLLK